MKYAGNVIKAVAVQKLLLLDLRHIHDDFMVIALFIIYPAYLFSGLLRGYRETG
ncbi:hypothetical protein Q7O_001909 [Pectobacterium carotovorum subsp. carotovorum PCCS1]|nr:hypothetical protein [Pectobacterium carotovorum subsp. carotovorum PCCS1]